MTFQYYLLVGLACLDVSLGAIFKSSRIELQGVGTHWMTLSGKPSKIIGHRGEPVLMPENTLGSYEIAAIENPDYIDADLLMTKDKHLVCFHLTLKNGTNVASIPELAHLQGLTVKGDWYIPDLTLAQIRMLKVKQKETGIRPLYFNDLFQIPTFTEFLDLIQKMSFKLNKGVGIIPELKHPDVVNERVGIPHFMENRVLHVLRKYGYPIKNRNSSKCKTKDGQRVKCGPVIIQCFHKDTLKYLSRKTDIELMMLILNDPHLLTIKALEELSHFVHYYAVRKEILVSGVEAILKYNDIEYSLTEIAGEGGFIPREIFPKLVHGKGMELAIYTIYDSREPSRRGCAIECQPENKKEELFYYFRLGVDAMVVENIKEAQELVVQYDYEMRVGFDGFGSFAKSRAGAEPRLFSSVKSRSQVESRSGAESN